MGDIDDRIEEIAAQRAWPRLRTAADLLAAWRQFVTECSRGYSMSIYEFENDRGVRNMIEVLLGDHQVAASEQYPEFRRDVEEEDARFRALLQADAQLLGPEAAWWERGVPRYAGPDLVADFADIHGVEIESRLA